MLFKRHLKEKEMASNLEKFFANIYNISRIYKELSNSIARRKGKELKKMGKIVERKFE